MKYRILTASLMVGASTNAFAHEGDHSAAMVANIMHWLSSPTHSLFAIIGGVTIAALMIKMARKKRV